MFGYEDIRVLQPDPHELDGDNDGVGCEEPDGTDGVTGSDTVEP
jgi:hypothetical protein